MTERITPTYSFATWAFLRLLGVIYLLAFWSVATQIVGLVGHDGILPARLYLDGARAWAAADDVGLDRFRVLPTLCWISTSDTFLRGLAFGGVTLSALLTAGIAPVVVLPLLWLGYLSLVVVGREFLSYQWDVLLLETGFLAIFLAPVTWRERFGVRVNQPRLAVWLMLWLLFRLMLGSGLVKLTSGDPTWRSLTALTYHYETQPIPTPVAWYAHQMPAYFDKASTFVVLAVELVTPFFIVGPRWLRAIAFGLFAGLQGVIAITGNYAFFNLLAASLCVFLLDDNMFGAAIRNDGGMDLRVRLAAGRVRRAVVIAVATITVPVSAVAFTNSIGLPLPVWPLVEPVAAFVSPFRSINSYGLFAVMTTTRPEIIVEGSDDGVSWSAYEFTYKPGNLQRRPPWVAPHQPRLDWQMWFAALSREEDEPWFRSFAMRLLQGAPEVRRLLAHDPFDGRAPRYIRGELYRYRLSDTAARRREGVWWTRERLGEYSPPLSLEGRAAGRDAPAEEIRAPMRRKRLPASNHVADRALILPGERGESLFSADGFLQAPSPARR